MGYKDKSPNEKKTMRLKEEEFISAVSRETKLDV
jgi:ssRNA-specific RNase YbeY (16S rRNA maturation enzyme)